MPDMDAGLLWGALILGTLGPTLLAGAFALAVTMASTGTGEFLVFVVSILTLPIATRSLLLWFLVFRRAARKLANRGC